MINSKREQMRENFDQVFLEDFCIQAAQCGHDPRNYIGLSCGFNPSRALEIAGRRVLTGL